MKPLLTLFIMFATITLPGPVHAQQKAKWNELDAFHDVMAQTFHPAEEGKLEPIRSRSQEMVDKAIAWKNAAAPEGFDKNAVKENLSKLVKGAREINKLVKKNAPDKDLKEKLSALHDIFHEIVEKCEKEEHM
jgi:hypothetical protein